MKDDMNLNQENITTNKDDLNRVLNIFKQKQEKANKNAIETENTPAKPVSGVASNPNEIKKQMEQTMSRESDPDLMTSYEIIELPSQGKFYSHGISKIEVEYMTSQDEDLLTTPSLIENGTVLDILLKRKIKTAGINPNELLAGDRNAIILFLRTSSYGRNYTVEVTDPRNNNTFKSTVDLLKLRYKELVEIPDENGYFSVELPMRKKVVKFRLLTSGEDSRLFKQAEAQQEAYNQEFSQFSTMKLKASVVSINEKTDRDYIGKFIDAMPALDAYTIRKKIMDVSPDVDMKYRFKAKDGYEFDANLAVGLDFFSPST